MPILYAIQHNSIFAKLSTYAQHCNPVRNVRLVAALYYKHRCLSLGMCQYKTHPFQVQHASNKHSIYLHAENDCLRKLRYSTMDFSKCALYVLRYTKSMQLGLAKPCAGCYSSIQTFGIGTVAYTVDNTHYVIA